MSRKCKCGCGASIKHKHPNAKFLSQKHKDKYHNWKNPRGKFSHLKEHDESEELEDIEFMHPHDSDNF